MYKRTTHKKRKKHMTFKTVCGRCGNEIHPKARSCPYCQLRIKEQGDILRVRADQAD